MDNHDYDISRVIRSDDDDFQRILCTINDTDIPKQFVASIQSDRYRPLTVTDEADYTAIMQNVVQR